MFYCVFIKVLHILFILFFCTVIFLIFYQNIKRLQVLFSVLSVDVDLIWLTQNNQNFKLKNQNDQGEFKILTKKFTVHFVAERADSENLDLNPLNPF